MNKLIKEILVSKKARSNASLMALIVTMVSVGSPWS